MNSPTTIELNIDNSAISLLYCKRRFQLSVLEGLVEEPSDQLIDGSIFHKIIEDVALGRADVLSSFAVHAEPITQPGRREKLLQSVFMRVSMGIPTPVVLKTGKPAVETKFSVPYGTFPLQDGRFVNINLQGTIDLIAIEDGILSIKDDKTSSTFDQLKREKKLRDYELAFQLPLYVYALTLDKVHLTDDQRALIHEGRYNTEHIITFYNGNPPMIHRQAYPPYSPDFLYREVPVILNHKIKEVLSLITLTTPAPHDGLTVYQGCTFCPFHPGCLEMGTANEERFLRNFRRKTYDPLSFR